MKKYEGNMQEPCDSIEQQSLWIICIEKGEEVQNNGIGNIQQIIAGNFQILRNRFPSKYRRSLGYQTDMTKIEFLYRIL
jgi:hypothetical protein